MVIETIHIKNACYERKTEWIRDNTIPWYIAYCVGTLTHDIGDTLKAGTVIFSGHLTRSSWTELKSRRITD